MCGLKNEFAVYSTDQQKHGQHQTDSEFKKFYQDILISFTNNKMFIAIKNDTDMFARIFSAHWMMLISKNNSIIFRPYWMRRSCLIWRQK